MMIYTVISKVVFTLLYLVLAFGFMAGATRLLWATVEDETPSRVYYLSIITMFLTSICLGFLCEIWIGGPQ